MQVRAAFTVAASPDIVAVGCADGIVRLFAARTLCFKVRAGRKGKGGRLMPHPRSHDPPLPMNDVLSPCKIIRYAILLFHPQRPGRDTKKILKNNPNR